MRARLSPLLFPSAVALLTQALPARAQDGDPEYAPFVAPASAEAQTALSRFELREGFEATVFAAEPLLANPVCLYADRHGVFWVAETFRHTAGVTDIRDHMDWLDADLAAKTVQDRVDYMRRFEGDGFGAYSTEHERVRRIVDTDGDGVADSATVFADGFSNPADGIGAGLLENDGDVYFTCIPDLWKLVDDDGDGRADSRTSLSSGYGVHTALLGHDLHGLRIGPDGRLYFSCGDRGFHVETATGTLAHSDSGAVLRCNLDGSNLEVFASGLRNPQELVFNEYGELFTGDNNSDGGDKARLVHVVEGSDSGWRFYYQWLEAPVSRGPWNAEKLWHPPHAGQAAYILPPIANIASGPSGFAYAPGTGLPEDWDTPFFLCDFRGDAAYSGIWTFGVEREGAGFVLGKLEKLVWNCLPTDVDFGPDGALYFSDWVHGWQTQAKGRIFRLAHTESMATRAATETRSMLDEGMTERPLTQLEALLAHADQRVRQAAHLELSNRPDGLPVLLRVAANARAPLLARLHGIWGVWAAALAGRDDGAHLELLPLLDAPEAEVRAQCARVLGDLRAEHAAGLVAELLSKDSATPRVRAAAARAAGKLGEGYGRLVEVLREAGEDDPVLRHSALMGLLGTGTRDHWLRLADDPSADVRIGGVICLRRNADAGVAGFLDDVDPRVVLEAARAIHDQPIPAALPALAALLEDPQLSSVQLLRRALSAAERVGGFENADRVARVAADPARDSALRVEALEILATWREPGSRDRVLGRWDPIEAREAPFLTELTTQLWRAGEGGIGAAPEPVLAAWIRLAREARFAQACDDLLVWLHAAERPVAIRVAALEALEDFAPPGYQDALDRALADREGRLRAAALVALERSAPQAVLRRIPTILSKGEYAERRAAYRLLGGIEGEAADALLLERLEYLAADLVPAELALDLVTAAEGRGNPELDAILATRVARRSAVDADLGPRLDVLFGGDGRVGKRIFENDSEVACLRCHGVNEEPQDRAARVGPDLGGVGTRLTRLQLLESIVLPNRRPTPGYEGTVLFLEQGGSVAGRVVAEDTESVSLMDAQGELSRVLLEDVAERRPDLSAMPQGLGDLLEPGELRDLIEYLASLR